MQVTELQADGLQREYKVVIEASDIAQKMEHRLQEIGQQVRIPGFRPGKVPVQILRQRYGQSVMGEVVERAVNDSSNQAISERGLRPALRPKIEITSFDDGKDLEYTMALELLPDIDIMDFAGIDLERITLKVPDDDVQTALERLAGAQKETRALDKPRAAKSGDVLVIDFRGTVDGVEQQGMVGEDHHLELGSNRFVAGFEDQLIGAKVGEDRKVTVTFPENYVNDKLAGQEAVFEVKIKDILETVPRAVDDELATSLGEDNLDALKGKVRQQIEQDYAQFARARMKRFLLDRLSEGHDFPVPSGMLEAEFEAIWNQLQEDKEKGQIDPEDEGKDEQDLKDEYRAIAERRVRLGLLLSEVGRINGIEVSQDELNRALVQEAQRHAGHEKEVFEYHQNTPEAMANLRAPIFEDKVIDFITALAKVTERSMTPKQLLEDEAAEEAPKKPKKKATAAKKPAAAEGAKTKAAGKTKKPAAKSS